MIPGGEVLTDPSAFSYDLLGARTDRLTMLKPGTWMAAMRATRGGFRQTRVQGVEALLGGVAIVDAAGVVRWKESAKLCE